MAKNDPADRPEGRFLVLTNAEWYALLRAVEFYRTKVTEAERGLSAEERALAAQSDYLRSYYTREAVLIGPAVDQIADICCC